MFILIHPIIRFKMAMSACETCCIVNPLKETEKETFRRVIQLDKGLYYGT